MQAAVAAEEGSVGDEAAEGDASGGGAGKVFWGRRAKEYLLQEVARDLRQVRGHFMRGDDGEGSARQRVRRSRPPGILYETGLEGEGVGCACVPLELGLFFLSIFYCVLCTTDMGLGFYPAVLSRASLAQKENKKEEKMSMLRKSISLPNLDLF